MIIWYYITRLCYAQVHRLTTTQVTDQVFEEFNSKSLARKRRAEALTTDDSEEVGQS